MILIASVVLVVVNVQPRIEQNPIDWGSFTGGCIKAFGFPLTCRRTHDYGDGIGDSMVVDPVLTAALMAANLIFALCVIHSALAIDNAFAQRQRRSKDAGA